MTEIEHTGALSDQQLIQDITGTMIWYYFICRREVWLISRQIVEKLLHTTIKKARRHEQ